MRASSRVVPRQRRPRNPRGVNRSLGSRSGHSASRTAHPSHRAMRTGRLVRCRLSLPISMTCLGVHHVAGRARNTASAIAQRARCPAVAGSTGREPRRSRARRSCRPAGPALVLKGATAPSVYAPLPMQSARLHPQHGLVPAPPLRCAPRHEDCARRSSPAGQASMTRAGASAHAFELGNSRESHGTFRHPRNLCCAASAPR